MAIRNRPPQKPAAPGKPAQPEAAFAPYVPPAAMPTTGPVEPIREVTAEITDAYFKQLESQFSGQDLLLAVTRHVRDSYNEWAATPGDYGDGGDNE